MKSLFGVIFAVIFVLCGDALAVGPDGQPGKLTELPLELLLDIYEDLDINNLANIARSHPYNWDAADIVFKNKFAIQTFDVSGEKLIHENDTTEFNGILNSLEVFGKFITKLKLDYRSFNDEQSEKVNEFVKYTADSLIEIELKGCNATAFKGLTALKQVEVVRLVGGHLNSNDVRLNEIFPNVRSLDVILMKEVSSASIEHNFPQLEELKLRDLTSEGAFRLNPQLRSVAALEIDWVGLRLVSQLLPQLDRFTFHDSDQHAQFEGDVIHFENMTSFFSMSFFGLCGFPRDLQGGPFVFGNLKEMRCDVVAGEKWFDAIIQNKQLRTLRSGELELQQYRQIVAELNELEEILIDFMFVIGENIGSIVELIKGSQSLKKIGFCADLLERTPSQPIIDQLPNWEFVTEDECYIFTR